MDRSVDADTSERLRNIAGWRGFNNPWMPEDDGDLEFAYINLLKNPERYTGYKARYCMAPRMQQVVYLVVQHRRHVKAGSVSCDLTLKTAVKHKYGSAAVPQGRSPEGMHDRVYGWDTHRCCAILTGASARAGRARKPHLEPDILPELLH